MIFEDVKNYRVVEVFTTQSEDIEKRKYTGVEVTNLDGRWVAEIGCWFDNRNRLYDYDGVYCLSMSVIKALRKAGWTVPREFENDCL